MTFSKNRLLDFLFGCVFIAGIFSVLVTLPLWFARKHWICDLFTHFRVQYSLALLCAALLLLFSARKKFSLLFLGFMSFQLLGIVPYYFPVASSADGPLFKVVLANVNSTAGDPDQVLRYLQTTEADLVVIQEFSSRWGPLSEALSPTYPYQIKEIREDNFGMALFSKQPLFSEEVLFFSAKDIPSLSAEIQVGDQRVFVLATHPVPPVSADYTLARNRQLEDIAFFLADTTGPVLLVGDLNTSPWSPVFKDFLKNSGLRNSMKGFGIQPTWPSVLPPLWIPIDHLLYSDPLRVRDRRIGPSVGSDHFPLEVTVQLP